MASQKTEKTDILATKKNYKNLSPAKRQELFKYIMFEVAQNYKMPAIYYIKQPFTLLIITSIFILFYIFNKDAVDTLSTTIESMPTITIIIYAMYRFSNKRKEDIL